MYIIFSFFSYNPVFSFFFLPSRGERKLYYFFTLTTHVVKVKKLFEKEEMAKGKITAKKKKVKAKITVKKKKKAKAKITAKKKRR